MKKDYLTEISNFFLFSIFTSSKKSKREVWRVHKHPEIEIGYIIEGSGKYVLEEREYNAEAGDYFLVRPNEQHCVPTITSPELNSFNIYISPYFLWNFCVNFVPPEKLRMLIDGNLPMTQRFHAEGEIRGIFDRLQKLLPSGDDGRFEVRLLLARLVTEITKPIPAANESGKLAFRAHLDDIQNVISFINENLGEEITLEDMTRASNMCGTSLSTSFKAVTGMTPYRYLVLRRIETAVELLRETPLSVTEIAMRCGFGNNVTFNRSFKSVTGLTPSEYRGQRKTK